MEEQDRGIMAAARGDHLDWHAVVRVADRVIPALPGMVEDVSAGTDLP
jgi:hypothetical protein